jgi:positive regulator of sigma E activity
MLIGVVITIVFGIFLGNIAYDILGFDEAGIWICVILGWITGILVTRNLARKVTNG